MGRLGNGKWNILWGSPNLLTVSTWTKDVSGMTWPGYHPDHSISQELMNTLFSDSLVALMICLTDLGSLTLTQVIPKEGNLKITVFTSWDTYILYPQTNSYYFYSLKSQLLFRLRSDKVRLTFARKNYKTLRLAAMWRIGSIYNSNVAKDQTIFTTSNFKTCTD